MTQALTVNQVAQKLAVAPHTVEDKIRRGLMRSFKVGRSVRVSEEDLAAFIEANRRPVPQEEVKTDV